ncbi:MAG: ankyrin repeat domain-containing protein [Acidobacteria bacterium]|nr:ankyrin repeat domain-containing protein [Acidobacteriota bacterium]
MTPAQQLHEAIRAGDSPRVAALIDGDSSLLVGGGALGMAPVLVAIYAGQREIAQELIARGAPVDPFIAAALGDTERCRQLLLAEPVQLNMNSSDGWTPLHLAAFFGHLETAEMLLAMGADIGARSANQMHNTPLHAAAAGKHLGICTALIAKGADVNATQHGGYTPLHSAAANGDLDLLRLLLAHEAKPGVKSEKGDTPLDMARQRNQPKAVELLERVAR